MNSLHSVSTQLDLDSNAPHIHQTQLFGEAILKAILLEVCCYPKPGLVTPHSSGAHSDMNLQTFMLSSAAIAPCFNECALTGFQHYQPLTMLLAQIRPIGQRYEQHLLATTQGVNTQRGILFSASVLCAAAGYLAANQIIINASTLSETCAAICVGLCQRDFAALQQRPPLTAGESLYHTYGVTGIRGEAEQGFPTVITFGLPALTYAFAQGADIRTAMSHCLINLIAHCEDTTVLWRGGPRLLGQLRQRAKAIVDAGGMLNPQGKEHMLLLNEWCCQEHISPGGCADLLALTAGMYLICHQHFPNGVM